ncbi:hypothetical protein GH714_035024 [Hevea brasiliensis]|uniref:Uncharacterized protein n=1 Tax=Hevea brasiliensis TaxID=3981 RepID=A0A6A6LLR5_HEVBR|nr:hypothetical protein GH714_035024 [Hevea brasiliensis]
MNGSFPFKALANLKSLETLDISDNKFSGNISLKEDEAEVSMLSDVIEGTHNVECCLVGHILSNKPPSEIVLKECMFRLHVCNVPFNHRSRESIKMIVGASKRVVELKEEDLLSIGGVVRVRVRIDVSKPLCRVGVLWYWWLRELSVGSFLVVEVPIRRVNNVEAGTGFIRETQDVQSNMAFSIDLSNLAQHRRKCPRKVTSSLHEGQGTMSNVIMYGSGRVTRKWLRIPPREG